MSTTLLVAKDEACTVSTKASLPPLHPFLAAVFPVITIWSGNICEVAWVEGCGVVLVALLTATCMFVVGKRIFNTREQAALAVTAVMIMGVSYGFVDCVNRWFGQVGFPLVIRHYLAVPCWGICLAIVLKWIADHINAVQRMTTLANVFTVTLAVMSGCLMASAVAISPWIWEVPHDGELKAAGGVPLQCPAEAPDIYLLVFDRYASQTVLAEQFNFDNRAFYKALSERGFETFPNSFANYPKTELAMSAMLNMRYHGERVWPKCYYRDMLQQHVVGRLLTQQGYQYYHLGNLHNGIRSNPHADVNYQFSLMPTELLENLARMTPLAAVRPVVPDEQQTLDKFTQIAEISSHPEKKFVYAHFLVPHPPWKFDRDGFFVSEKTVGERSETENYLQQLEFANQQIVATIDRIRCNAPRDTIIILQADEGPELRYAGDHDQPLSERIHQRSGILFAMHLPDRKVGEVMGPSPSPVNTFRMIFREYFGADLELLESRYFYWDAENYYGKPNLKKPCRFVDVTEIVTSL